MKALFFDCDTNSAHYLKAHPLSNVIFETVDFELSSENLQKIYNPEQFDIISVFAHAQDLENSVLEVFKNLKMIATRSTGFNHIDLFYCQKKNITVCNVPNYGATSVAEFTIGVILGLLRKITLAKSQMKTNHVNLSNYIGESIKGKTIGIIGCGAIGQAVIHLLQAFGAKIIAFDPYFNKELLGVSFVKNIDELYEISDIISLHCPATKENVHLLNKKAFDKMKNGVYIINTARGSLIDTESLYDALKTGKVAGAALDVLENEDVLTQREISTDMEKQSHEFLADSIINFKMLQLDNTLITPHIAFNSLDAIEQILKTTIDNIRCFVNNKVQNRVI